MKYRAEIDGLRALAVIPVILFHAGFELFSGGFVGVDIFFVISGYLITTILIEDIENKRFSIVYFYERRARRILPALFFVMLLCIPFAWMWMLPTQLRDFSQSLVAVSVFASNILFWRETGYFAAAAEEKPLLHTWSLSVEEQYYVVFPIFLILAWRFGKNRVLLIIVVMVAVSLLLSEWGWRKQPTANFYLAPTRAWELFAGSVTAFVVHKQGVQKNNSLALAGLVAIVFSIFFYNESTPIPSVYALVPVLGVVLLILYGEKDTFAAKLLSTKGFVGIGLISYSAYLWHQPLFAFARIRSLEHPSASLMLTLTLASLSIAYLSWRFIEKPFRKKSTFTAMRTFSFSAICLLGFILFGYAGHKGIVKSNYTIEVFSDWHDTSRCTITEHVNYENLTTDFVTECLGTGKKYILLGDSHAKSLSLAFRNAISEADGSLLSLLNDGCLPVPGTTRSPMHQHQRCVRNKDNYWKLVRQTDATVIISSRWRLNLIGPRFDNKEGGLEYGDNGLNHVIDNSNDIISHVEKFISDIAQSRRVIIISQIPEAGWNVPERNARLRGKDVITTSFEVYKSENESVINMFERLGMNRNVEVINVENLICDTALSGRCLNTLNGSSLYRDDDHPSPLLADIIAHSLSQILRNK